MNFRNWILTVTSIVSINSALAEQSQEATITQSEAVIILAPVPADSIYSGVISGVAVDEGLGIKTTSFSKIREQVTGREGLLLKYRNSYNLPEITHKLVLASASIDDKSLKGVSKGSAEKGLIGTLPRIKFIPCDQGCVGNSDYDAAVGKFLNQYDQAVKAGAWTYRGEMKVKVRWFHQRGFFERNLPLFRKEIFAISFPLEGKLITISAHSLGKNDEMSDMVSRTAFFFNAGVLQMATGLKPTTLRYLLPDNERTFLGPLNDAVRPVVQFLDKLTGNDDLRSRIEPMSEADNVLLPAIDGIEPNEIEPLQEAFYYNDF